MQERELIPIRDRFGRVAEQMRQNSSQAGRITPDGVYQEQNRTNTELVNRVLDELLLPGSRLLGDEYIWQLFQESQAGRSCLIFMEHYSNFDLPCLYYLLEKSGRADVAQSLVAIAGMKLNEQSAFVRAFTEAYTRVVIYPSRSLYSIGDSEAARQETARAKDINMAATRTMIRLKHTGRLILVFPSGTRYRPGRPETKRAVKEVDSYLKMFDRMVFVGVAGNVLLVNPNGDMSQDYAVEDVVVCNVSEPYDCASFRVRARSEADSDSEPKQAVGDRVMAKLDELHRAAEAVRLQHLPTDRDSPDATGEDPV